MAGKEQLQDDEVLVEDGNTEQPVEIELDEEEGVGDDTVAGGEKADTTPKADTAPKVQAKAKETGEETEEEARERKRQERQERKNRQREAKERNQQELAELREKSAKLEKEVADLRASSTKSETNAALTKAMADLSVVEGVIAKATEDGDGKKLVEAMRVRDTITAHIYSLRAGQKQPGTTQEPAPQKKQSQVNPAIVEHFQRFQAAHPDYKPVGNDDYSRAVKALDAAVASEGFDPTTQDYWDELAERVDRTLGKRDGAPVTTPKTTTPQQPAKGGPQVGSGRSQVMPGRQTYTISAERLNAMRDAGLDTTDPATLKKYAGIYQKFDRENAQA